MLKLSLSLRMAAAFAAVFAVAVFAVAVLAWPSNGQEPDAKSAPKKFQVYTWTCARSVQMVLATNDLDAAREAVEKAKKEDRSVRVTTGIPSNSLAVIREPKQYEVFVPGCRLGWRSGGIVPTAAQANELATKAGGPAGFGPVIVSHY